MVTIFIVWGSALAPSASALTVDDIQAQIKELLAKVADLTKQIKELRTQQVPPADPGVQPMPFRHRVCGVLHRNLSQGTQGDDVQSLQEFLSTEGLLSANATGYFGPMTAQALARWQASQGVESVGAVGPITQKRIKVWCGGGNSERFGAEPQRGAAPLTVTFKTNVQLANPRFVADAGDYKVVFGDGGEYMFPCSEGTPWCGGPHRVAHTYAADGTYTAQLVHYGYFGSPGPSGIPSTVVGTVTIYVGPVACTKEYNPVCGSKPIVCITTPCNPIQQTYSNRCLMNADGASFLYEGQCRTEPPICLAVIYQRPICAPGETVAPVDPTSQCPGPWRCVSGNKPPTISGFSGPTTLVVNATGTWTIQASDPENGQLSYGIVWGDGRGMAPVAAGSPLVPEFVQTTTFTHSFITAGTYTVAIVVRDAAGKEAKTSTTVRVGEPLIACTADATQCPNGKWVGRAGSNCQFVCP